VQYNTTFAERFRTRRALHTAPLGGRAAALLRLVASGAYKGGRGWTLGKDALLDDLSAAFVHRSRTRKVPSA
jgi:hypothetical protein